MWRKLWQATVIGLAAALLLTAVAGAAPKGKECPGHPSCPSDGTTPTTDPSAEAWTCVARARNGASAWVIGDWVAADGSVIGYFDRTTLEGDPTGDLPVPDHYRTFVDERFGVPACFDIHPSHVGVTDWVVAWNPAPGSSTSEKGKLGGLLMQFEREVHADVFWDSNEEGVTPRTAEAGQVTATWDVPADATLVFVAMPSHRDNWIFDADHRLTITPQP